MSSAVNRDGASSLSAAYTLLALEAYSKSAASTTTLGISEIAANGQARALTLPAGLIPKVPVSPAAAKVQFSRKGTLPAYFVLAESGFDKAPPTAEKKQGIEIFREFVDAAGNVLSRVTVGQEFFVRLRVRSINRDQEPQIAVVDMLPGGV